MIVKESYREHEERSREKTNSENPMFNPLPNLRLLSVLSVLGLVGFVRESSILIISWRVDWDTIA